MKGQIGFEEKKARALALMREKGMRPRAYAPLLIRFLWRRSIQVPPPLFAPFWLNTLFFSLYFGLIWGLSLWFVVWQSQERSPLWAVTASCLTGLLYGLMTAFFYRVAKKRKRLPDWNRLGH